MHYKFGQPYSLSLQAGIWDAAFLKENIHKEWTAWDFEKKGSMEIQSDQPILGSKQYEFPFIEGVRKGKWLQQGAEFLLRCGITPDYTKRPIMSNFETSWAYFKGGLLDINPGLIQKTQNFFNKFKH